MLLDVPNLGRVMVDTGSATVSKDSACAARDAGTFSHTLKAARIKPTSIDHVFLTHGLMDHVGGPVTKGGAAAFPNATVVIGRREHEFWLKPVKQESRLISRELMCKSSYSSANLVAYLLTHFQTARVEHDSMH